MNEDPCTFPGALRGTKEATTSELARLRAELREAQETIQRFRILADAVPQLVWMANEHGVVDYYNSRMKEYAGIEQAANGAWRWQPVLHPDDSEATLTAWETAIRERVPYAAEHRVRMRDGSYRWHLSRALPAATEGGGVRWYGTGTDIHALKCAEEESRKAVERYDLISRATNDVVWNWDLVANVLEWNEAVRQHFGCSPAELGTSLSNWQQRIHPDDRDVVLAGMYEAIEGHQKSWSAEYRFRTRGGAYEVFFDRGYIVRDASGRATRMLGSMLNVTEHRENERALREADRRKDELIAMLAHELRNPLGPIRSAIEVLRLDPSQDERSARARDIIDRQATHMARLIDDLLDASRVARGRIELRRERCDLGEIVRQTVDDYRSTLEAAGIQLALEAVEGPTWVDGDRTRLAQALGNLLHNAGKYTARGGRVTVALTVEGSGIEGSGHDGSATEAVVTVTDTGMGIPPSLLPFVFDPFTQAEQGIDRSRGGLGLGLALVKGLIELHGGRVRAESLGKDRGATFILRLPSCEPAPARATTPQSAPPTRGMRVLVVEDNHDAADTLALLLTMAGHEVEVTYDGNAGLDAARRSVPDAVVCDIGLPGGMDGYRVARELRANPATRAATLVALSGYAQETDRRRSLEAGFDAHLTKPVELGVLRAALGAHAP